MNWNEVEICEANIFMAIPCGLLKSNYIHMNIKSFLLVAIIFLATGVIQAKPQFGRALLFNESWRFNLSDVKEGAQPGLDDSKWRLLDLPHDWSVEGVYSPDKASATGYLLRCFVRSIPLCFGI